MGMGGVAALAAPASTTLAPLVGVMVVPEDNAHGVLLVHCWSAFNTTQMENLPERGQRDLEDFVLVQGLGTKPARHEAA